MQHATSISGETKQKRTMTPGIFNNFYKSEKAIPVLNASSACPFRCES